MRRRSRLLRVAKWSGVVVCGLIVLSFVASGWWGFVWNFSPNSSLNIAAGNIDISTYYGSPSTATFEITDESFASFGWLPTGYIASTISGVLIPLWLPLVLIAIPTGFLWWRDRPRPPGHCPCGYDLTGNESGKCPECGQGTE